jgi:hypothetical protein
MRAVIRRPVSPLRRYSPLFYGVSRIISSGSYALPASHFVSPVKVQVSDRASFKHCGYKGKGSLGQISSGRHRRRIFCASMLSNN